MSQPFRLPAGGRIDRSRTLRFRFDGITYEGHPGDTLASALLANGVRFVGRSFKYHRPRGIVTAGFEEPCALVDVGTDARRVPNTRATTVPLYDGLVAESQNRWPTLRYDFGAINARLARFLPAGFYYKTFMWPAAFWEKVYEPAIRHAAGLGRASMEPDPDHYEHAHAHCDVLVVGGGAAGLAAAQEAAAAGARVILAEMDAELGGGLLLEPARTAWLAASNDKLRSAPEVRVLTATAVVGYYDHNVLAAVETVTAPGAEPAPHAARERLWTIRAREVVLATGAGERLIAFPDNDRPGVMLASAALAYVRRHGVAPGRRAVLFANNDEAYAAAFALHEAGIEVGAIVDVRAASIAADAARAKGITVWASSEVVGVVGSRSVSAVDVRRASGGGDRIAADLLLVSGGWNPRTELASMTRAPLSWSAEIAAFVPGPPIARERSAGAARGLSGIARAVEDGVEAGRIAAKSAGFAPAARSVMALPADRPSTLLAAIWEVGEKGKSFVDLQHDVTADDIRLAHREGYSHVEHTKRYTTLAMATDQGKTGALVGAAVLAKARGEPVERVGLPNHRPYVTPVTWGAFAGHATGQHFQPIRRTPMHHAHVSRGAVFMTAGDWLRPAYYPLAGETGWDPILREARAVRTGVGICDVSTLGKIDVQGRDAATFLDRIYTNTFSTLPVGRARYGLMLREDGILFDDGTTSRLAPDRFFMTTTTAKAAEVLEHMEHYAQVVWPELDVQLASVTDQWAQMSIAGPRAREVMAACIAGLDLGNGAFPMMAVGNGTILGAPVRVFRLSFSGELAYEVATPAGYGTTVWDAILAAGRRHGIVPYGVEALGLMRVEKGHIAGPEINGHTTAADVGLGRMMKRTGDFVGRVNSERPGLVADARPRLVGIRMLDGRMAPRLRGGAHIVARAASKLSLGWVSSVTRSVELDRWIGLAMVERGPDRIGERMFAAYPLANEIVEVEITSPHHVDPENARVRA